jgi:hypothetical protein
MTRTALPLLYLLLVPASAVSAEDPAADAATDAAAEARSPEAVAILGRADEAARKVRAARFHSSSKVTGVITGFLGPTEGDGVIEGWDEELERPRRFWAHVRTQPPGAEEAKELTGGGDGETYFLIDHATRKAYEDIDPAVLGTAGSVVSFIGFSQLVQPAPYERDLESERIEFLGKKDVAGEECFKVRVAYSGGIETSSIWFFSTADLLPRKRVSHYVIPQQGEGDFEVTLTRLEVNPELADSLFEMKLPEGYRQIDDFAP